jgi:hypothetical protein
MRVLLCLLLLVFSLHSSAKRKEILRHWNVTSASILHINGTTNINSFQCGTSYENGADMIGERWDPGSGTWEIFGSIYIEVEQFDCNNRIMNNDFKNTLEYTQYPEIRINFLSLKEKSREGNTRMAEGWAEITIVGKTKRYYVKSELEFLDDYYSILRGEQEFHFSDFQIEPPHKGLGLVRVNNSIKVSFELILEQTALTEN